MERTALGAEDVPVSDFSGGQDRDADRTCKRRLRLKEATSQSHRCLDRSLMQRGYFANKAGFQIYLERMLQFQRAFEDAAVIVDRGWYCKWDLHQHRGWIESDLRQAGSPFEISSPVTVVGAPYIATRSALAGALYVLAGSSLGAKVLHRLSVERQLPGSSGSFYLARLATSVRWPEFLNFLETAEIASEEEMLEGAISTFECVTLHLNGAGVE